MKIVIVNTVGRPLPPTTGLRGSAAGSGQAQVARTPVDLLQARGQLAAGRTSPTAAPAGCTTPLLHAAATAGE